MSDRHFVEHDVPQGSPEWFALRAGRLTSSVAADMFKLKLKSGGEPAARRDLRLKLALERITHQSQEVKFTTEDVQWGLDHEAEALQRYEGSTGNIVRKMGFLRHTDLMAGTSLDGFIGDYETVVSIKCPKSTTHLSYINAGGVPEDYIPSMFHEMWISGAQGYDFVSYDPRFPQHLQLYVVSLPRVAIAGLILDYAEKALDFLDEVDAMVGKLEAM